MQNDFERRRHLVKAVGSMPLIATIPCGAALANSSAHQCMQSTIDTLADRGEESMAVILPTRDRRATPDEYLRLRVPVGVLRVDGVTVEPCYKLGEKFYDGAGSRYSGEKMKFRRKGYALVAIVFRPDDDMSDAELVGVWPEVGLYGGNTPLQGSCWTSLNPGTDLRVNV